LRTSRIKTAGLLLLPILILAARLEAAVVTLPDTACAAGQTLYLPLTINEPPAGHFNSFQFFLRYQKDLLNTLGVADSSPDGKQSLISIFNFLIIPNAKPGTLNVACASADTTIKGSEGDVLLYLLAQVAADCPDTTVHIKFVGDFSFDDQPAVTRDGYLRVGWPVFLSEIPEATLYENESLVLPLSWFYSFVSDPTDPDEDLSWEFQSQHGTGLKLVGDSLTITPQAGWSGRDTVLVTVSDPGGRADTTRWSLLVEKSTYSPWTAGGETLPVSLELRQNYPNPFNNGTTITFTLPRKERVTLEIYDVTGHRRRTLFHGELGPDVHKVYWDGRDDLGHPVPSGVYIYRLSCGERSLSRKLILAR